MKENAQPPSEQPIKILLADDQPQVRSALRLLLEQEAQAQIVGEAQSLTDLLNRRPAQVPAAILLDWELPGLSPIDGLPSIRQIYPAAQIVALSSRPQARQVALQAGADAFVCKGDPPEKLLAALYHENEWLKTTSGAGTASSTRRLE